MSWRIALLSWKLSVIIEEDRFGTWWSVSVYRFRLKDPISLDFITFEEGFAIILFSSGLLKCRFSKDFHFIGENNLGRLCQGLKVS